MPKLSRFYRGSADRHFGFSRRTRKKRRIETKIVVPTNLSILCPLKLTSSPCHVRSFSFDVICRSCTVNICRLCVLLHQSVSLLSIVCFYILCKFMSIYWYPDYICRSVSTSRSRKVTLSRTNFGTSARPICLLLFIDLVFLSVSIIVLRKWMSDSSSAPQLHSLYVTRNVPRSSEVIWGHWSRMTFGDLLRL